MIQWFREEFERISSTTGIPNKERKTIKAVLKHPEKKPNLEGVQKILTRNDLDDMAKWIGIKKIVLSKEDIPMSN